MGPRLTKHKTQNSKLHLINSQSLRLVVAHWLLPVTLRQPVGGGGLLAVLLQELFKVSTVTVPEPSTYSCQGNPEGHTKQRLSRALYLERLSKNNCQAFAVSLYKCRYCMVLLLFKPYKVILKPYITSLFSKRRFTD